MINTKKEEKEPIQNPVKESGYTDVALMDVQCHILIKDKDSKDILLNKRG